jgi:hypothetical protein
MFCDVELGSVGNVAGVPQQQLYYLSFRNIYEMHVTIFFAGKSVRHCDHLTVLQHNTAPATSQDIVQAGTRSIYSGPISLV